MPVKRKSCLRLKNKDGAPGRFFPKKNQPDVQLTKKKRG
ncbi:hypothetical protein AB434_0915 [Heyndrickxia coagulans]|uniref:Uncharacterized protein n=1 Tax=Heyndrickxia coagulans TaxID=1398 RepID=A0AAN0WA93_HEYCO|nr:hypothetical protein SB48_HM08orf00374 [Heyndrickxia coagulans]AKN53320.1 hypothetical protein AB434_0915 [Heyndrickxia coagulans]